VLSPLVERPEDLHIPAIGELEDAQTWFGVHRPQVQYVLVEMHWLLIMFGASTTPAQARDVHACQYRCQPRATSNL
jgi:hypothetical protein